MYGRSKISRRPRTTLPRHGRIQLKLCLSHYPTMAIFLLLEIDQSEERVQTSFGPFHGICFVSDGTFADFLG